jgi:hypothetical protein
MTGSQRRTSELPRAFLSSAAANGTAHALSLLLVALERVANLPERRRPQAREQRSALGVSPFVLVERLRPDPEHDAESNAAERCDMDMPATQPETVQARDEHV